MKSRGVKNCTAFFVPAAVTSAVMLAVMSVTFCAAADVSSGLCPARLFHLNAFLLYPREWQWIQPLLSELTYRKILLAEV